MEQMVGKEWKWQVNIPSMASKVANDSKLGVKKRSLYILKEIC